MIMLLFGLVLFLGVHSARIVAEGPRERFIGNRGEGAWKGLYSVVSLVGLVLIMYGYGQTRLNPVVVWNPPAGMAHLAALLTLIAFVLLAAAYVPGNRIRPLVGHPMVLGVKVWALAHLLANGRLGDMLLFGAFLAWAVADFASSRRRDRKAAGAIGAPSRSSTAGSTSAPSPGAAGTSDAANDQGTMTRTGGMSRDLITVAAGTAAWLIFALWLHRAWIGVSPFG